jgi:hypothetical protein
VKIKIPAAAMRNPADSTEVAICCEDAGFCDGSECGLTFIAEDGALELAQPHWHLIEKGRKPEAGPRIYPISAG